MVTRAPAIAVSGLEASDGDTAFAFVVLRFRHALRRDRLIPLTRYLAPLVTDADAVIDRLPDTTDDLVSVATLPWTPPRPGHELDVQRRLIESTSELGVEAAWFFQVGTSLASPEVPHVRFPVDGHPPASSDHGAFGIAFKLAGPPLPGTRSVLVAFHALWLAPDRSEVRSAAMTYDPPHHAAELWVEPAQLARHALWVVSKIDEVFPIVRARLGGPSGSSVVLGGNPLRTIYLEGGEAAVDRWVADQTEWANAEIARMLCELARELATGA